MSHDILLEYEEVLNQKYGFEITDNFLNALRKLPNVEFVEIYFQWKLLTDPDDDKFVDACISSGADYIVTEDSDFNVLKTLGFPKIFTLRLDEFKILLSK